MNTTISHQNNQRTIERPFSVTLPTQPETAWVEDTLTEVHHGKSITYFLWTYVAIFSSILACVFIEEAFFIK
jgi:hypothetical protein